MIFRSGQEEGCEGAGALSGRRVPQRYDSDSLHNEIQAAVDGRGLQDGEGCQADNIAEPELHGPAAGAGAEPQERGERLQVALPPVPLEPAAE